MKFHDYNREWDRKVKQISDITAELCRGRQQPLTVADVAEYLSDDTWIEGSKSNQVIREALEAGVGLGYLRVLRLRSAAVFMPHDWGFGPIAVKGGQNANSVLG